MNKVILIGRLVKDPDLKFAAGSGMAICKFTMAVNRATKDKQADFINCIAFDKRAETIAQYVFKGHQFAVVGQLQTGSYEDKDGNKRYTTDIVVSEFDFIQSKNKAESKQSNQVGFNDGFNPENFQEEVPF